MTGTEKEAMHKGKKSSSSPPRWEKEELSTTIVRGSSNKKGLTKKEQGADASSLVLVNLKKKGIRSRFGIPWRRGNVFPGSRGRSSYLEHARRGPVYRASCLNLKKRERKKEGIIAVSTAERRRGKSLGETGGKERHLAALEDRLARS